jgi:hypothetical protein
MTKKAFANFSLFEFHKSPKNGAGFRIRED